MDTQTNQVKWRAIQDSGYIVSNAGQVLRTVASYSHPVTNRPLKPQTTHNGYQQVHLSTKHGIWRRSVHSLVASAFLGKAEKGFVVHHKDGNKANNYVNNLAYVTIADNCRMGYDAGNGPHGEAVHTSKLTVAQVRMIRILYKPRVVSFAKLATMFGIRATTVRGIVLRKTWRWVL